MCFDAYCIPNNPPVNLGDKITAKQIDDIILRYTGEFGLTPSDLQVKHSCGRVVRRMGLVSLADIRKSLAVYISSNSEMIYQDISRKLGYGDDHTSITYARKTGKDLYDIKDEKFKAYWNKLMDVVG